MNQTLTVPFDVKALTSREISGHGSVFRNVDLGGDVVVPGAFRKSLAEHKDNGTLPQMFWMHQPDQVPGMWTEMRESEKGLQVKGELADTALGNDMRTLAKMKAVRGLSIGYRPTDIDFDAQGNRLLKSIDLIEVSLVSLAMNPLAQIESAKSRLSANCEYVEGRREFEKFLRVHGYSRKFAETAVSRIFDGPGIQGDPEGTWGDPENDQEAAAVASALHSMADSMFAGSLRR